MRESRESVLPGGFVNEVVRVGATVRRRPAPRSEFVRALLTLFEARGWTGAPRFLGTDGRGREICQYVEGRAALTAKERGAARTEESLVRLARLARLVRDFHDLTEGTRLAGEREVVCHNDPSPRNTFYRAGRRPVALIDWDTAAPGARIHDVAHLCRQYLGLGPGVTDVPQAVRHIGLICDAYGLDGRAGVVDVVLWWQERCRRGSRRAPRAARTPWSRCATEASWTRCGRRTRGCPPTDAIPPPACADADPADAGPPGTGPDVLRTSDTTASTPMTMPRHERRPVRRGTSGRRGTAQPSPRARLKRARPSDRSTIGSG
jgi:hypothetical protein